MTQIILAISQDTPSGVRAGSVGWQDWAPTTARVITGTPDELVVPPGFTINLATPYTTITVDPTGVNWAWKVDTYINGMGAETAYYTVPDTATVPFADLIQVDPATLSPLAVPEAAWWAAVEAANTGAAASATNAAVSATSAAASDADAVTQAGNAVASATSASGSATSATSSASAAAASAAAAEAVPTTTDTIMASIFANPASASATELLATYVPNTALGVTVPKLSRAVTQLARAPRVARILNAFMQAPAGLAVGLSGTTYSMYYGWGGGLWWKSDLVLDSAEPGGYSLHQLRNQTAVTPMLSVPYGDASTTHSGTFVTGTNAAAYNGGYVYSTTVASYYQATLPLGSTSAALHIPQLTNGGRWWIITIDGDPTKATLINTAQTAVNTGLLDPTQLVANGGTLNPTDRVFDSYSSAIANNNYDAIVPLATGLDPTAVHTVKATVTAAIRKGISAPNDRAYLAGFAYGSSTIGLTSANTIIVPVAIMSNVVSAWEHAINTLPTGATTSTFLGNVHGYEQELSLACVVDGTAMTLTSGQIVLSTQSVAFTRGGQLFHPQTGATVIAGTSVIYTMRRGGLEISDTITWNVGATVAAEYAMMALCGAATTAPGTIPFASVALLNYAGGPLTCQGAANTDLYIGQSQSAAAWAWGGNYGAVIHIPDIEGYTNDFQWSQINPCRWEDRNTPAGGEMTKFYAAAVADLPRTVLAGDVHSYRSEILFSYFPNGAAASMVVL